MRAHAENEMIESARLEPLRPPASDWANGSADVPVTVTDGVTVTGTELRLQYLQSSSTMATKGLVTKTEHKQHDVNCNGIQYA